ncbi:MAG: DUF4294 domain-containing protein [Bacteroidales bacterium]|jgi:hypothetical protein|nr:DUF4294 domain-containing protein [Bacteroidales bacterium]MDD3166969.1 DUF4294 domain-containing protein [Bacteroidales bacterium]MDD4770937.1 DUF4294 domain-containing protein [Bacteroidales bacterium]HKL92669.1 DUF4294 domain-containing protein [Bacteroidales bacterium]
MRKRQGILLIVLGLCAHALYAQLPGQLPFREVRGLLPAEMPHNTVYAVFERGDTIPMVYLPTVLMYPPERFRSAREERFYWKTVRDVKKVYPLSKIVYYTLLETMDYLETLPDEKSKEKHLKRMERDLVKEYEPMLRKMTFNQGKLLLKLIDRECDLSSYDLIRAYRGSFAAGFWQGVARLFRADLKSEYDPDSEDFMIERIIIRIEQGQL